MKLKVLVDNNTYINQYYLGEPAVSYYIEIDGCKILFDTGYSDAFIKNAKAMGIDLSSITHIVLSHGHHDHSKGLKYLSEFFDLSKVQLIAHPQCFQPKIFENDNIGASFSEQEISEICNYTPSAAPYSISDNCTFLGQIPELNDFEVRKKIGTTIKDNEEIDDLVLDDSALACTTPNGLFIITGCSHSGICNIVEYARKISKCEKVTAVLGGFHLFSTSERLRKTIDYFKDLSIDTIYPCHCVSLKAKVEMAKDLNIKEVGVGFTIEL